VTEAQVQRSFRDLFRRPERTPDMFERAEEMIDQLRPESPLRFRLLDELEELRELAAVKS